MTETGNGRPEEAEEVFRVSAGSVPSPPQMRAARGRARPEAGRGSCFLRRRTVSAGGSPPWRGGRSASSGSARLSSAEGCAAPAHGTRRTCRECSCESSFFHIVSVVFPYNLSREILVSSAFLWYNFYTSNLR